MDLQEFTSPLPKPWLNISSNSLNTAALAESKHVSIAGTTIVSGAGAVTLASGQVVDTITIIQAGRSANIGMPSSASIDAYLGPEFAVDGVVVMMRICNREPTNQLQLTSSEFPAEALPKAPSAQAAFPIIMYLQRISGIYTPLN